ncbi:flagellin N-terminal helical domain-containing protein [Paludibaculum fermentans]|uniref:Flagellin n=1 Tax=Paludibaculum fermentans TaxID=1473598 RepID=A0A7S7SIB5_PALFE|nr:flagellin [Paludibaculum fermentans]QOY85523.1 hypothetical protein IRI77_22145 [Paludibaculum fermentans]
MFSIQTNVNSLIAQENMRVNGDFQSKTIQRLTSGYRINQSGDDAAGLAVANKFRSDVAELSQGVRNANDGISTLQIIDGGMNNISKMIDRLKTLASQSASQTFSGDRKVLNDEFQTLLKEIDRQAQAVGLDKDGLYAKTLSVFVGGGRTSGLGAVDTTNGTVKLDLGGAAVDTKSLNLKGMQVLAGSNTTDIGTTSATHTVADILNDTGNTSAAGYTDFLISGSGFSDGNKIKVSVNTTGVSDIDTLVSAINDAIGQAGAGVSAAANAFKQAGISATAYTNVNGGKQLAFNSSYAPIQVQAGDVKANALMGNFSVQGGDPATRGAALATSVHGANTTAGTLGAGNVTVRIVGGGMASPVDITLAGGQTMAAAVTSLTTQISAKQALVDAGISVSGGSVGTPLTFTSSHGDKFTVEATGDSANLLGLGAFQSGTAGAVDYSTLTGANYVASTTSDTSTLEISLNGAAARQITVDLTGGNATAAKSQTTVLAASNTITASNDALGVTIDGHLVNVTLAHSAPAGGNVAAGGAKFAAAGSVTVTGGNISSDSSKTGVLAASNTITSSNDTLNLTIDGHTVNVGLTHTAPTGGAITASGDTFDGTGSITVDASTDNESFDVTVDGVTHKLTLADDTYDSSNIVNAVQSELDSKFGANIATAALDATGNLSITGVATGAGHSVAINSTTGKTGAALLGFTPGSIGYGAAAAAGSAVDIANDIQTQIDAASAALNGAHATVAVTQDGRISITNDNKGTGHTLTFAGDAVTSNLLAFPAITASADNESFDLSVDGVSHTLTLADDTYDSSTIVDAVQAEIDDKFGANKATASLDGSGNLVITGYATGTGHSVAVTSTLGNAGATLLGFTSGTIGYGTAASGGSPLSLASSIQSQIDGASATLNGAHATVAVTQDGRISIENDNKGAAHTLTFNGTAVSTNLLTFSTVTAAASRSLDSIAADINQQISEDATLQKAGMKADGSGTALKLDSDGTFFRVNGGAVALDADLGFGVSGSTFNASAASNLTVATSKRTAVDSNGAQQSAAMAFTASNYASDDQTLTVSVTDGDGKIQSQVVSLRNDATARSSRSIDEAVASINKQLQQSNIAALQGIVAVKETVSGAEKINFLSSGDSFRVSVSSTANNTGLDGSASDATTTAGSVTSATLGDVTSTISIDTMSNALKAVTSISAAISKLGSAQAAVGRGQNQLSYALSLAQSQISSFSAAESRIRDADVAAEAANLTKAQVLQQAAVAAMAQANSAPQLILSLLRG